MLWFKKGTIRVRLLSGFVLIGLLPLISATAVSVTVGSITGRQQTAERLESVAASRELAVLRWIDSLQQELTIVSQSDCGNERISVVVGLAEDNKFLIYYNQAVRRRFLGFLDQSSDLHGLFLADPAGRVILSTQANMEGAVLADLLQETRSGIDVDLVLSSVPGSPMAASSEIIVTAPVASVTGQPGSVIAGRARTEPLLSILDDKTGLGATGRTYLVDAAGTMLTGTGLPGRLAGVAGLAQAPTAGLQAAMLKRANVTGVYQDFRGRTVIGVYRWLPDLQALIAVEQDQSEAFQAITATLGINLVAAASALLLAVGLALVIVRGIVNPLGALADTATRIAAGDLEQVAAAESVDEISVLARAFNSMTAQLRGLIANLEHRVAERTQDLQRLALQLETGARVGREITSILEIDQLLGKVTELIQDAFGYYSVHIFLVDEDKQKLVYRGSKRQIPHNLTLDIGPGSLNGEAVLHNQAVLVNDVQSDPRFRFDINLADTRSELVVPLRIGDRVIGTLDLLAAHPGAFAPADLAVAQSLGDQISVAIENARLYDRSRELAILEERNRLARELHDSMNQTLYSVVLFTGAAYNQAVSPDAGSIRHYLERAERMAQQALKEMRLMVFELRPFDLEQKGLIGAMRERLETVEERAGIEVELDAPEKLALPRDVEECLFRIVQEALNNVLKHSDASQVSISVTSSGRAVWIELRDNGVGFDPRTVAGGIGLASMRERAAELGGNLEIKSTPGTGTCVRIALTWPRDEAGRDGEE